jgi:hypothetical protein
LNPVLNSYECTNKEDKNGKEFHDKDSKGERTKTHLVGRASVDGLRFLFISILLESTSPLPRVIGLFHATFDLGRITHL